MIALFIASCLLVSALFSRRPWPRLIIAAMIYAWSFYTLGALNLIFGLFILGLALLLIELYLPGFGIVGVAGSLATVVSLYLVYGHWTGALTAVLIMVIAIIVSACWYMMRGKQLQLSQSLVLERQLQEQSPASTTKTQSRPSLEIGQVGRVVSDCRPVGKIEVENERYEAISEGDYIASGEQIVITHVTPHQVKIKRKKG